MIRKFDDLLKAARERGSKTLAVAVAQDLAVLTAVRNAKDNGIADAILVGDKDEILEIAASNNIDLDDFEIIDEKDKIEASRKTVELVSSGRAHIVMKGLIDTSVVLKAALDPEIGLRTGNVLSHTAVFEVPGYDRLILVTDAGMNIAPDLDTKRQIIENAVQVAHSLDNEEPKVAVVCAKEKVDKKMPATIDAQKLEEMNKNGVIKGCIVGGPFGLDNAIKEEAAAHKGIVHPVAGKADILLVPTIEAGNILYKSMVFFANSIIAGVIVGAKAPIIINSRADSSLSKLSSIALSVLMVSKK
jgi:phosphate butyryltransferase